MKERQLRQVSPKPFRRKFAGRAHLSAMNPLPNINLALQDASTMPNPAYVSQDGSHSINGSMPALAGEPVHSTSLSFVARCPYSLFRWTCIRPNSAVVSGGWHSCGLFLGGCCDSRQSSRELVRDFIHTANYLKYNDAQLFI